MPHHDPIIGVPETFMKQRRGAAILLLTLLLLRLPPSASAQDQPSKQSIFPPELAAFKADRNNPVFRGAGTGHWDAMIRERGWILREGGTYRMWYTGYQETQTATNLPISSGMPGGRFGNRRGRRRKEAVWPSLEA